MTTTFTPPTVDQSSNDSFFGRYSIPVGQSVVRVSGAFQTVAFPWLGELVAAGTEATDWFLGGRTYEVSEEIADELTLAGYEVETAGGGGGEEGSGYGGGSYGSSGYGL